MKIEMTFLRSKVARRIFLFFMISALIPITVFMFLSFGQINNLLSRHQNEQLRQTGKQYGMAVLERLLLLKAQLDWIAQNSHRQELSISSMENAQFKLKTSQGFKHIGLITESSEPEFLLEYFSNLIKSVNTDQPYLKAGNSILKSDYRPNHPSRIFILRMLDVQHPNQGTLVAEIDQSYLWGDIDSINPEMQLCIFNELNQPIFCSAHQYQSKLEEALHLNTSVSGQFYWQTDAQEDFITSYWSLFLRSNFLVQKWTITISQSKANALSPLAEFKTIFAFVIILTLSVVALLSIHQIRGSLIPLEKILEGIHHISNKRFNKPIEVASEDEFKELASSINTMASQIDRQFQIMATMAEIDQIILSTLKIEDIIKIVLNRTQEIIRFDDIGISIFDRGNAQTCRTYIRDHLFREKTTFEEIEITGTEYQALLEHENYLLIGEQDSAPTYLLPLKKSHPFSFLVLPMVFKEEVSAMICLAYHKISNLSEEQILLARDFTNRVAVALSNANWEEQLYYMAHYDNLTGLPNRLLLKDRLQQALARAERQKTVVAVLFIDLDRFKYVNDSLGHMAGDALLCKAAQRLSLCLRSEDTISRIGGDEFVIVISHFGTTHELLTITTTVAKKIIAELSMPFTLNEREVYSTASVGIAFYPEDGQTTNDLLKNADSAMYHAKSTGKNNYQFYSRLLNSAALERLDMENNLRNALKRAEFELYYQPRVETRGKKICGAEVLLRWNHPQLGRVSPARFIPLCEEIGLIIPIGEWVIQTACKQAKIWQEQGFPSLRIAVNLSPLQFRQPDLPKQIQNALMLSQLNASHLELEITESAAMEDIDKTIATLETFNNMGLHLSIDDFGTGYSSLSYLKRFPIHTLKIDQSFIRNLNASFEDAAIVKSVVMLAHSLRLSVVAEGVETQAQLDYLYALDCDEIQGYLLSPPLSADEFGKLLTEKATSETA